MDTPSRLRLRQHATIMHVEKPGSETFGTEGGGRLSGGARQSSKESDQVKPKKHLISNTGHRTSPVLSSTEPI